VFTATVIVSLALASLFYRYYGLQIVNYEQFLTQSERNRVRLEALPPTRGLIFDRNGELLASNEPSQLLAVVVERAGDLSALLDRIESLIGLDPEERIRFQERRRRSRPYDAVPLKLRLTDAETAVVGVNRHTLPGATIEAQLTRAYPHGELLSHVLGYVGRINTQETQRIEEDRYRGTFHIGKVGLEKYYEDVLLGRVGNQNTEANAHGRVLRVLDQEPPNPGTDLKLHLDLELQRVAAEALGDQRGAVVALDPRNGGVLALVSKP
jgi:penicillin-binding protein 2